MQIGRCFLRPGAFGFGGPIALAGIALYALR
jgi:chromate transport protein ChrA